MWKINIIYAKNQKYLPQRHQDAAYIFIILSLCLGAFAAMNKSCLQKLWFKIKKLTGNYENG